MVKAKKRIYSPSGETIDINACRDQVKSHYKLREVSLIKQASLFSESVTRGLATLYGQSCLQQGLDTAEIVLDLKLDQEAAAAAIVTSVLGSTSIGIEEIESKLGAI